MTRLCTVLSVCPKMQLIFPTSTWSYFKYGRRLVRCYTVLFFCLVVCVETVGAWCCPRWSIAEFSLKTKSSPSLHVKIRASADLRKCLVTCFCIRSSPHRVISETDKIPLKTPSQEIYHQCLSKYFCPLWLWLFFYCWRQSVDVRVYILFL